MECTGQGHHPEIHLILLSIHIMLFKSATTLHTLSLEVQQQNVTSSNVRISAVAHDVLLLINGKYIICGYI